MTKKEQKYIKSLKDENDRLRSLLIRFMDAVGKLTNIDDVVNMSLIPIMTEKTKRFKAEFKAEAYKEYHKKFEKNIKDVKVTLGQTWEIQNALKKTLNELVGDGGGKRKD